MKCYKVSENNSGYAMVLFAESASKARYVAFCYHDEHFEDFIKSVTVSRVKAGDQEFRNHTVMDWMDGKDRLFLVKELDWSCTDDTDLDCGECVAKCYCPRMDAQIHGHGKRREVCDSFQAVFR